MTVARAMAAAAWIAVAAVVVGLHPAMHLAPMAGECRQLAESSAHGPAWVLRLGLFYEGVPWAAAGLILSIVYIAFWGFHKLTPATSAPPPGEESTMPVVAILAGHAAASVAAWQGAGVTAFQCWMSGITALVLLVERISRRTPGTARPRPASWPKVATAAVLGLALILLTSTLDTAVSPLIRAPLLPEAWYSIGVESASNTSLLRMLLTSTLTAAAVVLMAGRSGLRAAALPSAVLLLGASYPLKSLATAIIADRLDRAGGGTAGRAGFLLASIALFVALLHALA